MRSNDRFKRAYNRYLDRLAETPPGTALDSETALARELGVSRTIVRGLMSALAEAGLVSAEGRARTLLRAPREADRFPQTETESVRASIEKRFMEMVLQHDVRPGEEINNLELARQFAASPTAVREYLSELSQTGLLDRRRDGGWVFRGFDRDFARELFDIRELFELRSAALFAELPDDHPAWARLDEIERRHHALIADIDHAYKEFSRVDADLHELVNAVSRNRFIDKFQSLRSLIFHYHYLWTKDDEKERNLVALKEHLVYIAALKSRNRARIRASALAHLRSARRSLLASIARTAPD